MLRGDTADGGRREHWPEGSSAYFEYHCWESDQSHDADLWHRSHQIVTVTGPPEGEDGALSMSLAERTEAAMPLTYPVLFPDGFTGSAWEDELLTGPEHYYRPGPPPAADAESMAPDGVTASGATCECHLGCRDCSEISRDWHLHDGERCPVHPDAPVVL